MLKVLLYKSHLTLNPASYIIFPFLVEENEAQRVTCLKLQKTGTVT